MEMEAVVKFLGILIGVVAMFLSPILGLVFTVMLLMLLDFIFGILRARKVKESITSRKMFPSVLKMITYIGSVILVFSVDKHGVNEIIKSIISVEIDYLATKAWAVTLCIIEGKSLDENCEVVTGISPLKMVRKGFGKAISIKSAVKKLKADE